MCAAQLPYSLDLLYTKWVSPEDRHFGESLCLSALRSGSGSWRKHQMGPGFLLPLGWCDSNRHVSHFFFLFTAKLFSPEAMDAVPKSFLNVFFLHSWVMLCSRCLSCILSTTRQHIKNSSCIYESRPGSSLKRQDKCFPPPRSVSRFPLLSQDLNTWLQRVCVN